jgi:hypothetical protein
LPSSDENAGPEENQGKKYRFSGEYFFSHRWNTEQTRIKNAQKATKGDEGWSSSKHQISNNDHASVASGVGEFLPRMDTGQTQILMQGFKRRC